MSDRTEIETGNDQLVGANSGYIIVLMPKTRMTRTEALRHAAYLVLLAEEKEGQFDSILKAIQSI